MDTALFEKYQQLSTGVRSNKGEPRTPREELMVHILELVNESNRKAGFKEWSYARLAGRVGKQDIFILWGRCKDASNPLSTFMYLTQKKKAS